jgi:hypothetical protein
MLRDVDYLRLKRISSHFKQITPFPFKEIGYPLFTIHYSLTTLEDLL